MASTTRKRATALPIQPTMVGGTVFPVVPNFGIFIDTHRDQPHVQTFEDDLHRGMTKPTLVHYLPPGPNTPPDYMGRLIRAEDGRMIDVHEKHRFVEVEWWSTFVQNYIIDNGKTPMAATGEQQGQMPTSHLRDARKKVYALKSLRQMVRAHEKASATVSGTAYKPKKYVAVTLTAAQRARNKAAAALLAKKMAALLAKKMAAAQGSKP